MLQIPLESGEEAHLSQRGTSSDDSNTLAGETAETESSEESSEDANDSPTSDDSSSAAETMSCLGESVQSNLQETRLPTYSSDDEFLLSQFLLYARIPLDDAHTRMVVVRRGITRWTEFIGYHEPTLTQWGFRRHPAQRMAAAAARLVMYDRPPEVRALLGIN